MFDPKTPRSFEVPVDSQGDYRVPDRSPLSNLNSNLRDTNNRASRLSDCIGPTHDFQNHKERKEK